MSRVPLRGILLLVLCRSAELGQRRPGWLVPRVTLTRQQDLQQIKHAFACIRGDHTPHIVGNQLFSLHLMVVSKAAWRQPKRKANILVATVASEKDRRTLICTAKLHSGEFDFCSSTFGTWLGRPRLRVHLMTLERLDGGQLLAQIRGEIGRL